VALFGQNAKKRLQPSTPVYAVVWLWANVQD
jgi:hypothetical protein